MKCFGLIVHISMLRICGSTEPFRNISKGDLPKRWENAQTHKFGIAFKLSHGNVDATSAVTETVRVKLFSAKELSLHWTWNRLALALTNKWSKSTIELASEWDVSHLTIGITLHSLNDEIEKPAKDSETVFFLRFSIFY